MSTHDIGAIFEGRYEILAKLGEGGFGEVYKAAQRTTGQAVALKLMRMPRQGDAARLDKRIARFMRETRLCAQLHHPNIVQLIDSGRTEDGLLYTVFSFAPGETLADVLAKQGALSPREAHHLMLQVLDALVYAHAQGVIHRDLKPSNIMIMPSGARRNALVLDFGIGAVIEGVMSSASDPSTRLTATDETLGTPGYAAPEQLRGLEPSAAVDIFAWGLLFIECLTGRPVYTGNSAADIMYQQMGPEPVPLPAALERHPLGGLLRRATRKDVDERNASARELFEELDSDGYESMMRGLSREALVRNEPFVATPDGDLSMQRVLSARASTSGEERRQVTALSCKVSEPSASGEEASERVQLLLEQCAHIAEQHGGHLAAVLDDQVLIYFGYPRAREDDARRAAQAALAIAAALGSNELREAASELRMGMHTGVVVARKFHTLAHGSLALGSTPHRAVQTAKEARPGEIALTPETHRLLQNSFEVLAEDAAESSTIRFRLASASQSPRTSTSTLDRAAIPLVGREQEQGMLLERWTRARNGVGQCSLVTGEPGIGKSRLVSELRARMRTEPHIFLECRCSPTSQNSALYPVIELLRRLVANESQGLPANASSSLRLEALLARHELPLGEAMPLLGGLLSIPISGVADLTTKYAPLALAPHRQKELTLESVISLLFSMAEEEPVLLLVEDLHWADPSTIELLTKLVSETPSAPMYVVLTARPEFSPPFPTMGMLQLHLDRLPAEGVRAMIDELLDHKALPPSVVDQVVSRTDGVPLFVEELTRMIVESDALVLREDRYELTRPLTGQDIPLTLRDLLTARLDNLGRAKESAQLAAAIGREFDLDLLRAASTEPDTVTDDVNQLLNERLVQRQRRKGRGGYIFRHALIRDAAYDSLTQSARQTLHGRIALTIEEKFPALATTIPGELARHYAGAGAFEKAVHHGTVAAQASIDKGGNVETMAQSALVATWLPDLPDELRVDAELRINGITLQALMSMEGWASEKVRVLAEKSRKLLPYTHTTEHTVSTLFGLFMHYFVRSDQTHSRGIAEELVAFADRIEDSSLQSVATTAKAVVFLVDGRFPDAETCLEKALRLYDPVRHQNQGSVFGMDCRVWASTLLAWVELAMGRTNRAFQICREAVAWAREIKHIPSLGIGLLYLTQLLQMVGDRATMDETLSELLEIAKTYGLPAYEAYGGAMAAWSAGDAQGVQKVIEILESIDCNAVLTYYGSFLADIEADAGNIREAIARVETWLGKCEQFDQHLFEAELFRRRALYEMRLPTPDMARVRASLDRARRLACEQGAARYEMAAIRDIQQIFGDSAELAERRERISANAPDLQSEKNKE